MFAFVIIHRPRGRDTSIFTLYVAMAESAEEAIKNVTSTFAIDGTWGDRRGARPSTWRCPRALKRWPFGSESD
jgi:hypothetical protein